MTDVEIRSASMGFTVGGLPQPPMDVPQRAGTTAAAPQSWPVRQQAARAGGSTDCVASYVLRGAPATIRSRLVCSGALAHDAHRIAEGTRWSVARFRPARRCSQRSAGDRWYRPPCALDPFESSVPIASRHEVDALWPWGFTPSRDPINHATIPETLKPLPAEPRVASGAGRPWEAPEAWGIRDRLGGRIRYVEGFSAFSVHSFHSCSPRPSIHAVAHFTHDFGPLYLPRPTAELVVDLPGCPGRHGTGARRAAMCRRAPERPTYLTVARAGSLSTKPIEIRAPNGRRQEGSRRIGRHFRAKGEYQRGCLPDRSALQACR